MYIRVLFIDDGGQKRLAVADEIGHNEDNGSMWFSYADYNVTAESANTVSDFTYNDLLDKALIHGYVDLTTVGKFIDKNDDDE